MHHGALTSILHACPEFLCVVLCHPHSSDGAVHVLGETRVDMTVDIVVYTQIMNDIYRYIQRTQECYRTIACEFWKHDVK